MFTMMNLNDIGLQPLSSFPVFKANQVLSADDLNLLVEYLHGQTRWTRLGLIGVGPVCGLVPRWNKTDGGRLDISAGFGVTSRGYLIHLDQCQLTHYQETELSGTDLFGESGSFRAFELLEEQSNASIKDEKKIIRLDQSFAVSKVVLILLQCLDDSTQDKPCTFDCDETGKRQYFKVGKFLVEQTVATQLLQKSYESKINVDWPIGHLLAGKYMLDDLYLERFGYPFHEPVDAEKSESRPVYTNTKTYTVFTELYQKIIDLGVERVLPALKKAHLLFSPLFTGIRALPLLPAADGQAPDRLDEEGFKKRFASGESNPLFLQYLYDHLFDLILAHDELCEVAFDLMDGCNTDAGVFPKHLLLGKPSEEDSTELLLGKPLEEDSTELPIPPSVYRTPLTQPPVYNGNGSRVGTAALLFKRLELMLDHFYESDEFSVSGDPDTDVRITPSRWGSAALSERAIPYYYSNQKDLRRAWNGNRHRSGRDWQTLGYHFQRLQPIQNDSKPVLRYEYPLVFDFEAHDFFRIEGHIGMEKTHALQKIIKLRERYNLPFDIVLLRLGEKTGASDLKDCEIAIFQAQYTKLRTDLMCALKEAEDDNVEPLLNKLRKWDKLDDFVYPGPDGFETAFDTAANGQDCLLGSDKAAFRELYQLFTERREAIEGQELFHEFARKHPGIEHKAGVPRGGTFILVYRNVEASVEEQDLAEKRLDVQTGETAQAILQERIHRGFLELGIDQKPEATGDLVARNKEQFRLPPEIEKEIDNSIHAAIMEEVKRVRPIVIGDFCLPYLCCSNCPPNAYVFVKPRPILLLVPVVFCKNDPNKYPFVVDPVGGRLSSDSGGIEQEGERFFFMPKDTTIPEGRVRITYTVDGVESMLLLHILPEADAGFSGLTGPYCSNDDPVELKPDSEFVESRFDGNGVEGSHFDPRKVKFDKDEDDRIDVVVTHRVIDETTGCPNSSEQTVTVYRAPDAGFGGLDDGGSYCREDQGLILVPNEFGGKFSTDIPPSNIDPSNRNVISVNEQGQVVFSPQSIVFAEGQDRLVVQVTHEITRQVGDTTCKAESTRRITVYPTPQATFGQIPTHICLASSSEGQRVPLIPDEGTAAGGEFTSSVGVGIVRDSVSRWFFDPRADDIPLNTLIEIRYVVTENGCTGSSTQITRVLDASFSGLRDAYCKRDKPSKLIPAHPDGVTSLFFVEGRPIDGDEFDPSHIRIPEGKDQVAVTVTHRVTLRDQDTDEEWECESDPQITTVIADLPTGSFGMVQGGFDDSSVSLWIYDIKPQDAGGTFVYLFRWESALESPPQPNPQEKERDTDADFALRIPWGDLPDQGPFTLTLVLRCRGGGGEGAPFTGKIMIDTGTEEPEESDEPDEPSEPGTSTSVNVPGLLLSRGERNLESIRSIAEENAGISRTRTFARVEALLRTSFDRLAEELIRDYEDLIPALLSAYSRAQSDRKIAYAALAQTATLAFFDRIATRTLTDEARDLAKAQLAKLEDAGIGLTELYETAWLTAELEGELNSEQIERVRSLIE